MKFGLVLNIACVFHLKLILAANKMEGFKTPQSSKTKGFVKDLQTPVVIPESPFMEKIGWGTGVNVYSLKRYSSPWAVKKIISSKQHMSAAYAERLKEEATVLSKLKHPNIVGFRAFTKSKDGQECLAMEECEHSIASLIEYRAENGLGPFPVRDIIKVVQDVACGLDYLHNEVHLLHGDIKSFNILVKGKFETVKLCDFGVTLPLDKEGKLDKKAAEEGATYIGTYIWSAPEVLGGDPEKVTSKADIFSFGLVIWEMLALSPPNMDDSCISDNDESIDDVPMDKVGTRPELPDVPLGDEYKPVIELFNWCTNEDPNDRPTAIQLVLHIKNM